MASNTPLQGLSSQPTLGLKLNPTSGTQSTLGLKLNPTQGGLGATSLASQPSLLAASQSAPVQTHQLAKSTALGGSLGLGAPQGPQLSLQTGTTSTGLGNTLKLGQQPPSTGIGLKLGQQPATTGVGLKLGQQPATTGVGLKLGQQPPSTGIGLKLGQQPPTGIGLKLGQQPTTTGSSLGLGVGGGIGSLTSNSSTSAGPTLTLTQPSSTATGRPVLNPTTSLRSQVTLGTTSGSAGPTASVTSTQASGPSGPKLTYKKLEDQINKWSVELEEQERQFLEQAQQINNWDQLLTENADKILKLNTEVEEIKANQERLENELDFITAQQSDLEEMLQSLEKTAEDHGVSNSAQHTDQERQRTYQLAESLDSQLKRMGQDLKDVVEHLNMQTAESESSMAPIHHIAKILNLHMETLQWVDQNAAIMKKRVEEISRMSEARRREQENSFRLAFD